MKWIPVIGIFVAIYGDLIKDKTIFKGHNTMFYWFYYQLVSSTLIMGKILL